MKFIGSLLICFMDDHNANTEIIKKTEEPCNECLDDAVNTNSSKPVRWEERK